MDISYVRQAIDEVFSKSGYKIDKFTLFCPDVLDVQLTKKDDSISFDFKNIMPKVQTKKLLIPLTAYVEGISLGVAGGTIKLKYFPDFNFNYSEFSEQRFGASTSNVNIDGLKLAISKEYPDIERRKIANLALQYANEWGKIVSQNDTSLEYCKKINREKVQKDCYNFVYENIVNSKEIKAKSAILTFILVYLVLPAVIKWVVKKFLDNFFK